MKNPICKYCGTVSFNEMPDSATEEELLKEGTMLCNCYEAQLYQKKQASAIKAKFALEEICKAEDNELGTIDERIRSLLETAIDLMPENVIYKISVAVCSGGNIDIKSTASGKIALQRSLTLKQKNEVE